MKDGEEAAAEVGGFVVVAVDPAGGSGQVERSLPARPTDRDWQPPWWPWKRAAGPVPSRMGPSTGRDARDLGEPAAASAMALHHRRIPGRDQLVKVGERAGRRWADEVAG